MSERLTFEEATKIDLAIDHRNSVIQFESTLLTKQSIRDANQKLLPVDDILKAHGYSAGCLALCLEPDEQWRGSSYNNDNQWKKNFRALLADIGIDIDNYGVAIMPVLRGEQVSLSPERYADEIEFRRRLKDLKDKNIIFEAY